MDTQSERLGSLMAFSDIGLILSTYGVLLAFNFLVEPISINTWIVCTFFVGIKILVVGIADITGIGKSVIVSMIFVVIADGVTILINQLMAFGLSMKMLLVMTIVDLVVIMIAVLIWKMYSRRAHGVEEKKNANSWVYDEHEASAPLSEPVERNTATSAKVSDLFEDEEKSNALSELPNPTKEFNYEEASSPQSMFGRETVANSVFNNEADTIDTAFYTSEANEDLLMAGGQTFLSFDEITSELPSEEEIEAALKAQEQQYNKEEAFKPAFSQTETTESSKETVIEEPEIVAEEEETSEETPKAPTLMETFQRAREAAAQESSEPEKEEESVPEIEEAEVVTTETTSVEPETQVIEEVPTEEVSEESPEKEEPVHSGFTIPITTLEPNKTTEKSFAVPNFGRDQVEETETIEESVQEPFGLIDEEDFREITGTLPKLSEEFKPLSVEVNQTEVNEARTTTRAALVALNDQLNLLIDKYNRSLTPEQSEKRIDNVEVITEADSIQYSDRLIRNKLKDIIEREFVQDDVLHNLISVINKISNRSYTLDVAEDNLKERERLEKERQAEQRRREEEMKRLQKEQEEHEKRIAQQKKEAEERRRRQEAVQREEQELRARQEERAKQKAEQFKQEQQAKILPERQPVEEVEETVEETVNKQPVLMDNEIHLQNDELDIIIDAKDLELLKEFLKQQEN